MISVVISRYKPISSHVYQEILMWSNSCNLLWFSNISANILVKWVKIILSREAISWFSFRLDSNVKTAFRDILGVLKRVSSIFKIKKKYFSPIYCKYYLFADTIWSKYDETLNEKFALIHRNSAQLKFHHILVRLYKNGLLCYPL